MDKLEFRNPVFREGVNTTIRRGIRFAGKERQQVLLTHKGETIGIATIIHTKCKIFDDLTLGDVDNDHDPSCKTYESILASMRKTCRGFDPEELVTVVDFVVDGICE